MKTKDLSQKVLETIKKDKIQPKPRWEFLVKDYFVWALFIFSVFIGSVSVSVSIFMMRNEFAFNHVSVNSFGSVLSVLPYFWLLILFLFLFLAFLNFKHTKTGYRHNTLKVLLSSIIVSLVFGGGLYYFGISEKVERDTYDKFPIYKNIMEHRANMMISPEDGHLGGILVNIDVNNMKVKSFDGIIWDVSLDKINSDTILNLENNSRVRIIGNKIGENSFEAEEIMPWLKGGGRRHLNNLDERKNINMRINYYLN